MRCSSNELVCARKALSSVNFSADLHLLSRLLSEGLQHTAVTAMRNGESTLGSSWSPSTMTARMHSSSRACRWRTLRPQASTATRVSSKAYTGTSAWVGVDGVDGVGEGCGEAEQSVALMLSVGGCTAATTEKRASRMTTQRARDGHRGGGHAGGEWRGRVETAVSATADCCSAMSGKTGRRQGTRSDVSGRGVRERERR